MSSITHLIVLAAETDDSSGVGGVFGAALLALISLASIIAPRGVWMLTSSWRYRNAEAMEPSKRFFRVTRLSGAISFILWSAFFAAGVFPGETVPKIYAALITASVGLVATVLTLIVSAIVRGIRSRAGHAEEESPVNELSEAGYADQYVGVGISAAALVIILVVMAGIPGQIEANRIEAEERAQRSSDRLFGNYGMYYPNIRESYDAVQPGTYVGDPISYVVPDAVNEEPAYLYGLSPSMESNLVGARSLERAMEQSTLVIVTQTGCDVKSYVLVETDETVAIGVQLEPGTILPGSTTEPTPAPTPSIAERICSTPPIFGTPRSYYFVALPSGHLGDRAVTTLDGTPLSVEVIE